MGIVSEYTCRRLKRNPNSLLMEKLLYKVENSHFEKEGQEQYEFYCPGCECSHFFLTPRWTFNNDMDNPNVSPSILVRWGKHMTCHLYIKYGHIEYLGDCTHKLASQLIKMQPY